MGRLSTAQAAEMMEVTPQFIRVTLQNEKVDWGYAVRMSGGRYTYYINKERLEAYLLKQGKSQGRANHG